MRVQLPLLAFVVGAVSLFACGGSPEPVGPVALTEVAGQSLSAECDLFVRCGAVTSAAACDAFLRPQVTATIGQLTAAVANGTVKFDPAKAGVCLDELRHQPCDQSQESPRGAHPSCQQTFAGTVADNGACALNEQCLSGSCAYTACPDSCCSGKCSGTRPPPAALGQACGNGSCVASAYCNALGTCAPLLAEGHSCESDRQCAFGTVCAGGSASTCTKTPVGGGACLTSGSQTGICDTIGLVCDASNHCVKSLGVGAPCSAKQSVCAADLVCDPASLKCLVAPAAGAACLGGRCAAGAHCVQGIASGPGTCTADKALGEACQSGYECQSSSCQAGHCADAAACIKK